MVASHASKPLEKADTWDRVPPNVTFEIDDVESPWPPRAPFDFIHSRYMLGSIQDWPKLLRQSYEYVYHRVAPGPVYSASSLTPTT